ncbi:hypothetical protein IV203_021171 [Nitzschia inconspicua]|uniref:Transmembrane protein n=1 Tax=Nitzschia inconspicua TaxID=303405 RepID=A0A9K3PDY9_9STRA|nr:hypothetical protein IV203_021171 [Nitzschia inconspicua]
MEVAASRSPPYGFIILTFLYVTFTLVLELVLGGNQETLNIVRWSTSFFMAIYAFILAIHLTMMVSKNFGFLAFATSCVAYVLEGIAYLVFDDTGGFDVGLKSNTFMFYIFNIAYYSLWTLSTVILGWSFRNTWRELQYHSVGTKLSSVFSAVLTLSLVSVITASFWSAFVASSDYGNSVSGEAFSKSELKDEVALRYFQVSRWIWYGILFSFYVITAAALRPLLHAIRQEADIIIWGLSSVWAVEGVIFFQLASFGFQVFFILTDLGRTAFDYRRTAYSILAFQYCMMMTFFFLHNIVFSLSHVVFDHDDSNFDEELGMVKNDEANDTSDCSSNEDSANRKTLHEPDNQSPGGNNTTELEHEALPTVGSNCIQPILRMASIRRPQKTHIRASQLPLHVQRSDSRFSSSSSSCSGSYLDDSTSSSRKRDSWSSEEV